MSALTAKPFDPYNGLRHAENTLPAVAYHDQSAFERDLHSIWYRNWVHVCRSSDVDGARAYRTVRIGTQEILLVRDETGALRGFHNTCRHRGSELCPSGEGRLKGRLIVCPYHTWSYALDGRLIRVPSKSLPDGFDRADHPLYQVAVEEWRGFVFINLSTPRGTVSETFDSASLSLANWPLEGLAVGHRYAKRMKCNWKIFWENFNECLHCPNVHPELSSLVPIYGRGLMARHDDPEWARHADNDAPEYSGGLRAGAESWTADGKAHAPRFEGLTAEERAAGQSYAMHLPSMFVVGHVDYVRTVRLLPIGPDETDLVAEWFFTPESLAAGEVDIEQIVSFGRLVLDQDAAICEVNQRGLRSMAHRQGMLMPEEYDIHRFHDWVRAQHAAI